MSDRKKILIIDDEVDLRMLMRAYFLRKNYEVCIAHQIGEALIRLAHWHPNLILPSTDACQNVKEDIRKIKEAAVDAEIIINGQYKF